ncbi:hypothetical protein Esti_003667 [Eimeria stiedai]
MDALGNPGYAQEVSDAAAGCRTQVQPDYHAGAAGGAPAVFAAAGRARETPEKESDDSGTEGVSSSVHAQRLGVDIPLDQEEEELTLQSARIFKIENLQSMKKLKKLALIANDVSVLEGLEAQGPTLQQLELYQNSIVRIDNIQHLFELLPVTDLSFNKIKRIENLEPLVNLKELYLSSNKITKAGLQQLKSLPCLSCTCQKHRSGLSLSTLTELRLLELGSNRIREIEGIEQLTELTDLWLGKNKITDMKLPPLRQLERISLQSNRLEAWNVSFFEQCPKVKELYLSHNNLPSPPKEISQQTELTVLDLGCNRVEEVEAVVPLSQLQDLWLNDNRLDTIEKCRCLKDLPALETLYLERNPLQANLGPGYRQAVTDVLPRVSQLDALLLHTSVKVVQHPEKEGMELKGQRASGQTDHEALMLARFAPLTMPYFNYTMGSNEAPMRFLEMSRMPQAVVFTCGTW